MREPYQMRVKRLASHRGERLTRRFGQGFEPFWGCASVDSVPHHRVADMAQMHPDLVGASGFQTAFDQARDRPEALDHLRMGDRGLPLFN